MTKPICNASYMGSYARTRFCEKPAGHDGEHDWADFYREDMKPNGAPMTNPDSTDAGGVTHAEARNWVAIVRVTDPRTAYQLGRYIDQQESALATLTRERETWQQERADLIRAGAACAEWLPPHIHDGDSATAKAGRLLLELKEELTEPATPPAPLPGGHGPTEALRHLKKARQHWRTADNIDAMRASLGHVLSYLESLEQAGEGRGG